MIIKAQNNLLLEDADFTSLSSSATAADSTLTVYSTVNFANSDVVLIGEFGQEGSEIIATSSSSGTTVNLASGLVKSHPKDTKVYIIPYNQVQFFSASTITGTKTTLTTKSIDAEKEETTYSDTATTSGYYFSRWFNSSTNNYSDYSDPLPITGHATNTVGFAINHAMSELGKEFSDTLTYDMLIAEVNSCLRYIKGKLKRWSNTQEFDYTLTQMDRGEYRWSLPTTYYDKNSNRSCLSVRIGDRALEYIDWIEFKDEMEDVHHTTISTAATTGATSLVLTSAADFDSTGTVHVYSGNTLYEIDYTAITGNTLTCTALTADLAADLDVWQGEAEGTPQKYTIADGYLYIWPLINSTHQGENVYMDFYTDITEVNSDSDEITLARHDMVKHWLKWAIRNITEKNGKPDLTDGDWIIFSAILTDAIRRESSGQKFKMKPQVNGINYRDTLNTNFDTE